MQRGTREYALWSIGILLILTFSICPVLWIVSVSLKAPATITEGTNFGNTFIPQDITFDNYDALFTGGISESPFLKPLINSILIGLISTVIAIVLAAFAAYAIARLDYPGLIIPYLAFALPLAIYVLVAFFREIPWDLEQAAQVDGATPFQAFRKVIVPLAAPGVFTAAILVFIFAWNDFIFANTLTSTDNARTVPAALAFFTGASQFEQPIGAVCAASVVVTVPIIVMVLIFQRRIVAGLTAGAVKG